MSTHELIIEFIKRYFEEHCYAPSYEEIAKSVGICKATLHMHMKKAFMKGELVTDYEDDFGKARAFRPKGYRAVKED